MQKTKEKIILAAEKLFATEGIEGVSLRRISAESGQRNNSALQYHFGNRETLLDTILEYRMTAINERREAMLASIETREDVRAIVSALVYPFIEQVSVTEDSYYVGFLARYFSFVGPDVIFSESKPWMSGVLGVNRRLQDLLSHLPGEVLDQRLLMMGTLCVQAIADYEHKVRQPLGAGKVPAAEQFASVLVDYLCGGLTAELTEQTQAVLQGLGRSDLLA